MNIQVFTCAHCGSPMPAGDGQSVLQCPYCRERFFYAAADQPAVAFKPAISLPEVKQIALQQLRHPQIDRGFRQASFFEKATLFFIPFFEVRGIRAGYLKLEKPLPPPQKLPPPPRFYQSPLKSATDSGQPTPAVSEPESDYICNSLQYLERANDLRDLALGFIDLNLMEDIMLQAEQIDFNPAELRKKGVILPVTHSQPGALPPEPLALPLIEYNLRTVYFPVWEICYSQQGILFKSYVEAVGGRPLKIQALKSRRRNLLKAIGGLFALGVLLARAITLLSSTVISGLFLAAAIGLTLFLLPYFWQLFAFQEMIEKGPLLTDTFPIQYGENSLLAHFYRLLEGVARFFGIRYKKK